MTDIYVGGASQYTTLQQGIQAAESSGSTTIIVNPGLYSGESVLTAADNNLSIIAASPGVTVSGSFTLTNASGVTISGLAFEGSGSGVAIQATASQYITVSGNSFSGSGQAVLLDGSINSTIINNSIVQTTQSAIEAKNGADNAFISNNVIDGCNTYSTIGAIWLHGSNDSVISHNQISNTSGAAISLSDFTPPGSSFTQNNNTTISFNTITDVDTKSEDSGAIYVLGRSQNPSTNILIAQNYIGATGAPGTSHAVGIYLDDNASGVTVTKNIVQATPTMSDPWEIHGGSDNIISGNIFDLGSGSTDFGLLQIDERDQYPQGSFLQLDQNSITGNIYTTESSSPHDPGFADLTFGAGNTSITGNNYWAFSGVALNVAGIGPAGDSQASYIPPAPGPAQSLADYQSWDVPLAGFGPIETSQIGPLPDVIAVPESPTRPRTITPPPSLRISQETSSGYSATGALTVSGTALAGETVTIYDGSVALATLLADATTGIYSTTLAAPLADGAHSLAVTATDGVGNSSAPSAATQVIVDTTAPVLAITAPSVLSNGAGLTISGTATDANSGSTVLLYDNGFATPLALATIASNGTWSANVTLAGNGAHSLVAQETDLAGNVGSSAAQIVAPERPTGPRTITPPPSVRIGQETSSGYSATGALTVSGTALAGGTVTIYDGSLVLGTLLADATTGLYSTTLATSLADGAHSLTVTATDGAGNSSAPSAATQVIVDTTAPVLSMIAPSVLAYGASLTISGTATDANSGSTVSLYDNGVATPLAIATIGSNGAWSANVTLGGNGAHSLVAQETDLAGNVGSSAAQIVRPFGAAVAGSDPLIDTGFYFAANPDVAASGMTAAAHYLAFGAQEGRNPDALFSTVGYLAANPDVAAAGINPLTDFETTGWKLGHDPSAGFDVRLYLQHNPDVAASGMDPLQHYLLFGQYEGRATYAAIGPQSLGLAPPGFDRAYYELANPDVARSGMDPLVHYQTFGWKEGRMPDAVFDVKYYLAHNPDVAASGIDPLTHYDNWGWKEGRDPSAGFSTGGYLTHNPDVAAAGVNPLQHYLSFGIFEGRAPVL